MWDVAAAMANGKGWVIGKQNDADPKAPILPDGLKC
jgi:hypothetical protein